MQWRPELLTHSSFEVIWKHFRLAGSNFPYFRLTGSNILALPVDQKLLQSILGEHGMVRSSWEGPGGVGRGQERLRHLSWGWKGREALLECLEGLGGVGSLFWRFRRGQESLTMGRDELEGQHRGPEGV